MTPPEELLAALDPEQRQVAEALRGPVRVLAGAGTGKTRAITHRIAYGVATGVYAPTEVLAVTFTTRAAGEMRSRLRRFGAQARAGAHLPLGGAAPAALLLAARLRHRAADPDRVEDRAAGHRRAPAAGQRRPGAAARPRLRGRVGQGQQRPSRRLRRSWRSPAGARWPASSSETVGRVFASYEEVKRGQGRMDMEDVLLLTAGLLADDERVAAQVRRQYKWFVVDEFQDVSPLQSALLDLWLGGRDELCVVGDPAQTIYSFAGADAGYLTRFPAKYPGTTSIELVRNYRSTPQVVAAANTLLAGSEQPGGRAPRAAPGRPGGALRRTSRRGRRGGGRRRPASTSSAARAAASARSRCCSGSTPSPRPSRTRSPTTRSPTSCAARPASSTAPRSARRSPGSAARPAPTRVPATWSRSVRAILAAMGWSDEPPEARGRTRDRWESWQALMSQAEDFARAGSADLGGFVDDLDRRAAEQHAPVADGVTLATFHAAKGLEWDSVFLCGLQDGTLPITYADTPGGGRGGAPPALRRHDPRPDRPRGCRGRRRATPARRRGASRHGSSTRCSPTTARAGAARDAAGGRGPAWSAGGRWRARPRSSGGAAPTARCPTTRRCSSGCGSGARSVPATDEVAAFMVFSNSTLEQIAEHRPRTADALLRISGVGPDKLAEVRRRTADTRRLTASPDLAGEISKKVNKWFAPYTGAPVTFPNQQPRTTVLARPAPDDTEGGGHSGQHQEPELDAAHVRLWHARLSAAPSSSRETAWLLRPRDTWVLFRPTSRGPMPGVRPSVDTQQIGSLQAAEPTRDPRPSCFSRAETGPQIPLKQPTRSGQRQGGDT